MNKSLNIPEAIDTKENVYIKAYEADAYAPKGRYLCRDPRCKKPVKRVLRKSTCFFRHYPDSSSNSHKKNYDTHTKAVNELFNQFQNIQEHGLTMPTFILSTRNGCKEIIPFLPQFKTKKEWAFENRIIDVAIVDKEDHPILLMEVLHTHKVSDDKAAEIEPFPWVEIKASSILQNQRLLKIERHHRFPQECNDFCQLALY